MAFVEVLSDSRYDIDGAGQATGYRIFESDTPVDSWEGDPTLPPQGSAHPFYPDLKLERFEVDPLIGNARTRVKAYYSNYDRFSSTVYLGRKQGQPINWTTTFTRVADRLLGCVRDRRQVQKNGTTETQRVWTVVPFDLTDQVRIVRKAAVVIPFLTTIQLEYIVGQSGKLHYFGSDTADPTFSSGNWYRFEAPDGIETSKTEISFTYSWVHDPGITTKAVPDPIYAFGIPESGYLRKPWHVQVPIPPNDPTQETNPIRFAQFRPYDEGGTNGRGWATLPGMVLP